MKKKSIKSNAFFNTLREILDLVAPLITFPYVTRVLMPDNLGKVQFAASIVAVFSYFASLGLPLYGVRKIAAVRDNLHERSKVFKSLLTIELVTTSVVYIAFICSLIFVEKFHREIVLYLIIGIRIGLKTFGFQWFFKGMEEYKFMAYRKLLAKIIGIILVFTFIKGPDDYVLYGSIAVITMFISRILNYFNLRKMIEHVPVRELNVREHINGAAYFFLIFFSAKLYHNTDKIMLGFMSGDASVSYYVTANKLIKIVKSMFTAATAVLIPRFSNLIAKGNTKKVKALAQKAFSVIFFLPLPAMIGLYILSYEVVMLFGGKKYLPAVLTMRLLLPILLIIPLKSFIGKQILLTYGKQRLIISAVLISTAVNIVMNFLLIPRFSHHGAAAASILSEFIVIIIELIYGWSYIKRLELKPFRNLIYVAASILMGAAVYPIKRFLIPDDLRAFTTVVIVSAIGAVLYALLLIIMRESLFVPMIFRAAKRQINKIKRIGGT